MHCGQMLKEVFKNSGINDKIFSAHSFRSASTSGAFAGGVQLKEILETANWTNAKTFYTFTGENYEYPILFTYIYIKVITF